MSELVKKHPHAVKLSIWRIAHLVCAVSISFFIMPFLIHHLGKHYYGIWILVSVFSAYYGMVDLGLSTATQRYISQAIGRKDAEAINQIVSTALVAYTLLGIVVLILGGAGYLLIPHVFHWKIADLRLLRGCFLILLCGLAISFPLRSFTGMLGAALRQDITAKLDILYVTAKAIGTVVVIYEWGTIISLAWVTIFVDLSYYVVTVYLVRKIYLTLKIGTRSFSINTLKKLLKYAFFSLLNNVSEILKFRFDSIVISSFLAVSQVTVYNVAFRLFEYFSEIIVSAIGFSDSYFSRLEGAGEKKELLTTFLRFTKISAIVSAFIGVSLICYGKTFIFCWVGPGFEKSYQILPVLIIPGIILAIQDPLKRLFFATSRHYILAYISLIEGSINVMLSIILVRHYGLMGVALGTAIPSLAVSLVVVPIYGCSIINLQLRYYWLKTVMLPTAITASFVIGYFFIIRNFLTTHFGPLIAFSIFQTIIFVPFCYLLLFDEEERYTIDTLVKKALTSS